MQKNLDIIIAHMRQWLPPLPPLGGVALLYHANHHAVKQKMQKNFSLLDDFFLDFVQVVKPKVQVAVEKKSEKK